MTSMIHLKNVNKEFRLGTTATRALDNLNLDIDPQEFVAIVGPSGSGKTTLLTIIGALDRPTSGEVVIAGANIQNLNEKELVAYRRDHVGFIFQTFNLIPNLTALENVMLPMEFTQDRKEDAQKKAKQLLQEVKVDHRTYHKPAKLSGGEQQRVAIARSLANNPDIILADEPTGNLDSKTGREIVELLKNLAHAKNKTVIVITHDIGIVELADEKYTLRDGKIVDNR